MTIIGDSVTLRASTPLKEVLPDAQVDAQGSRNTAQAREILSNNAAAGGLLKTVVVATGVNIVFNYEEELNELVKTLPKGHRLILVTPTMVIQTNMTILSPKNMRNMPES